MPIDANESSYLVETIHKTNQNKSPQTTHSPPMGEIAIVITSFAKYTSSIFPSHGLKSSHISLQRKIDCKLYIKS